MAQEGQAIIGVIGGVGPYAGLDFVRKIFDNTRAVTDQDHANVLLVSCPALIPDRTGFILGKGTVNPAVGMHEAARMAYRAGARILTVACNTSHSGAIFPVFEELVRADLPGALVVNMIRTCADYVEKNTDLRTVGLLATKGTHASRVYHEYFTVEKGFTLIEPEKPGQEKIHAAIYDPKYGIKAKSNPPTAKAAHLVEAEAWRLCERGAQAVILGCTELPLAFDGNGFDAPVFDPGLLAARELLRLAAPERLLPMKKSAPAHVS